MKVIEDIGLQFAVPPVPAKQILDNIESCELLKTSLTHRELIMKWDYQEAATATAVLDSYQPDPALPELPSPMMRDYNWPGIYKPFNHQRTTASFLSLRKRAFCFNEQGTGKTSAAIWAADYLMQLGFVRRALVVCPLSIMYSAWQRDIFNTAMHRSVSVAHGSAPKREKIIRDGYDFVVINYDGVKIMERVLNECDFDLIIVDEANAYKTASTKRWKTLARLIKPSTYLWMMTGTPASQSPMDAFGLARMIAPTRVPKYMTAWRDKVMYQVSRFRWVPNHRAEKLVHHALQPAIRFRKNECLDLPDVTYQTRDIPMTRQAALYYKELKSQMLIEAAGEQITAVNAAASLSKLLQISGGAVYTDKRDVVEFDISPRLQALGEVIDETLNKVIVFVPYLHTIQVVEDYLKNQKITHATICGDVPAKERGEIIRQFQSDPDPRVLVIQPQSASHGVTLTAADTIVFWSPVMSVETYLQCIARIDRVGQKNKMTVIHIQGSDVERKVYKMLQGKVDSHQKLVDLYKQELGI